MDREYLFIHSEVDDYGFDPFEFRIVCRCRRRGELRESAANIAIGTMISERKVYQVLDSLTRDRVLTKKAGNPCRYSLNNPSEWVPRQPVDSAPHAESSYPHSAPHAGLTADSAPDAESILHDMQNDPYKTPTHSAPHAVDSAPHAEHSAPRADKGNPRRKSFEVITPGNSDSDESESSSEPAGVQMQFSEEDWQYRAAELVEERLIAFGTMGRPLTEKQRQQWALVFARLERCDHHTVETIGFVMKWLLREDNWWITSNNFASAKKLRDPDKQAPERKYFDRFLLDARKEVGQSGSSKPINKHNLTASHVRNAGNQAREALRRLG